ncbi:MAG TPA: GAF domain-containing protein [Solirubrobacteraceae bacterium]|nr:GAF domain-containing protein [Solirubrobacteraceae bacterium]
MATGRADAGPEATRLAEEQAALRRVATLVARESSEAVVFRGVTEEAAGILDTEAVGMLRFESDGTATLVAQSRTPWDPPPLGTRLTLEGENILALVLRTGQIARFDDWADATGAVAAMARGLGIRSSVAAPIIVEGRLWGAMIAVTSRSEPLPAATESRIGDFTELVATAVANAEARGALSALVNEQEALRRVATLVAEGATPARLFARVAREVAGLLGAHVYSAVLRYEPDDTATVVGVWDRERPDGFRVGARLPIDGSGVTATVHREKRPVRADDYSATRGAIADLAHVHGITSAVGCPILVQSHVWGAMVVAHYEPEPFPAETEQRVSQFTELMATAIVNTAARAEVERLAEEQAALRRVATLVAQGKTPTQVFDAVVAEMARLLGAAQVALMRVESPREITIVAARGFSDLQTHAPEPERVRVGMRLPLDGESITTRVLRTGRSARIDRDALRGSTIASLARRLNVNVSVGAPVVIDGTIWGVMAATWIEQDVPAADAEERLDEFAALVGTAIANADSRDQLMASRARVLTAGDEARRRVARDLHDGAQQRLVHTILTLKLARRALAENPERAESLLTEALDHAEHGNAELRELAHGILPAVLTRGGLLAGVDSLVSRLDLPVNIDVTAERLPPEIEASAYFVVAEGLTNVIKHSQAAGAAVRARIDDNVLAVEIRDDGIGGADPKGHGLLGLSDRVAALGGRLTIDSHPGKGTTLMAELPRPG